MASLMDSHGEVLTPLLLAGLEAKEDETLGIALKHSVYPYTQTNKMQEQFILSHKISPNRALSEWVLGF